MVFLLFDWFFCLINVRLIFGQPEEFLALEAKFKNCVLKAVGIKYTVVVILK